MLQYSCLLGLEQASFTHLCSAIMEKLAICITKSSTHFKNEFFAHCALHSKLQLYTAQARPRTMDAQWGNPMTLKVLDWGNPMTYRILDWKIHNASWELKQSKTPPSASCWLQSKTFKSWDYLIPRLWSHWITSIQHNAKGKIFGYLELEVGNF